MRAILSAGIKKAGYTCTALLLVLGISVELAQPVYAMNNEQRKVFDNAIDFYNVNDELIKTDSCGPVDRFAGLAMDNGSGNTGGSSGPAGSAKTDVPPDFNLQAPISDNPADGVTRRKTLMQYLITDFQLTPAQAAGIMGNFMQESGGANLPPNVNQGGARGAPTGSGGYGWAQWTGSRNKNFRDFNAGNGLFDAQGAGTDRGNYAYLKWELQNGYANTITQLKTTNDPRAAATSFHNTFEKSADGAAGLGERGTSAIQALDEFEGRITAPSGGGGGSTPAPTDQLVSASGACPPGGQPGGGGGIASSAECGTSAECAQKLLALEGTQVVLTGGAKSNLQTAAAGQQLTVCPQGPVTLNATLLQVLIRLAGKYKLNIHNFSAPNHSCDGAYHTKGRASDIHLEGVPATAANLGSAQYKAFAQDIMDLLPSNPNPNLGGGLGQADYIGPLQNNKLNGRYFGNDGVNHIHVDVGSAAP